jgi:predicted Rossmann fold nucleotide-binding protein DprA/Smf involved in DNA uptake
MRSGDSTPGATVYRLLICGSRDATPPMLQMARNTVARAAANGWQIVVGDAFGVDQAVVFECVRLKVKFDWYGITDNPRNRAHRNTMVFHADDYYHKVDTAHLPAKAQYIERDRVMVRAADRVFAICCNMSRGTLFTYNYALEQGKPADIRHFRK